MVESPAELDPLAAALTPAELYDSRWMLAYEADVRGWLAPADGKDFVGSDGNFAKLKAAGVRFYDDTKTAPPLLPPPKAKASDDEGLGQLINFSGSEDTEDEPGEETGEYF